jgi:hypothetical protein
MSNHLLNIRFRFLRETFSFGQSLGLYLFFCQTFGHFVGQLFAGLPDSLSCLEENVYKWMSPSNVAKKSNG